MVGRRRPHPTHAGAVIEAPSVGCYARPVISEEVSAPHLARRSVGIFVGLSVVCACLTVLFLSMRAVMKIGGYCASGGPYEIAVECPNGVPGLMIGSIWIGLGALLLYSMSSYSSGGPRLAILAWPVLFLSLGWNFLEFGLDPGNDQGIVWSWIICAILFFLMGGGPLLLLVRPESVARILWGPPGPDGEPPARAPSWAFASGTTVVDQTTEASGITHATIVVDPGPADDGESTDATDAANEGDVQTDEPDEDLVDRLERLSTLHRRGSLSDAEFTAAKQALLSGGAT
jgi:hypothetical protein